MLAGATVLGELQYAEWFSFKATLALTDGTTFRMEPRGFWGTTIEVKDEAETVLLSFKMHWDGNIVLKSRLGGTNRACVLKNRGLTKGGYVLLDKHGQELLTIQPDFTWNKVNHDYAVVSSELFETYAAKDALVLTAIHCANYYMAMATAIITTTII